jgi:hypothetical protein
MIPPLDRIVGDVAVVVHRDPALEPERERLSALESELIGRERVLFELKTALQRLQSRYLAEIGVLYRELSELEAAVIDAEIRAGIRPPPCPGDEDEAECDDERGPGASCANPAAPSVDLKRMFRDVAKAIHPDLAVDEAARCRRHSLMAEANRAYAERDADRLRLILHAWERSADGAFGAAGGWERDESDEQRVRRRLAAVEERLSAIAAEEHELRTSAIARLQQKIDEARAQGWDLFAEMRLQVKRELARAQARLVRLRASGVEAVIPRRS